MGSIKPRTSFGEALFGGIKQRVMALLFGQPARAFHGNELMRLTSSGKGALQRELGRLTESGLVSVTQVGNQKRYQANPASPIFDELCSIVLKTFGLADVLRQALMPLDSKIEVAFVYGSVAKRTDTTDSDIDLLVVSDTVGYGDLIAALGVSETKLGRKISPTLYTAADLQRRRADGNSFILRILEQPKLFVIGEAHELGEPGKSGQDRVAEQRTPGPGGV
ncbi:MAG: transcriptional regulator [Betaproteobacteria bacterium]|nr:transcriptional regulator [Betaproteobacteria bacterium]